MNYHPLRFLSFCELLWTCSMWKQNLNPPPPTHTHTQKKPTLSISFPISRLCCWLCFVVVPGLQQQMDEWRPQPVFFYHSTSWGIGGAGSGCNLLFILFFFCKNDSFCSVFLVCQRWVFLFFLCWTAEKNLKHTLNK